MERVEKVRDRGGIVVRNVKLFDCGHPDVLIIIIIIRQQIKCTSNTSTFIVYDRLHVSTFIGSSSGLLVESSH